MRRCPQCSTEYPDDVAFCGNDGAVLVKVQEPDEEPDARLGRTIHDRWVLANVIGDGAMGRVYEAREASTRERVAIKFLHPHVQSDRIAVERFKREAETARSIGHPGVVEVKVFDQDFDGTLYMVMEFLDGEELGALLRRDGALPLMRALRITAQAALALEAAHEQGVFHRDVKPDNLYLVGSRDADVVKVLDFGSVKREEEKGAKLTAFGTTLGSPFYMSPEQAMGTDIDRRTDVWALGCIVFEMLTGKIAFDAQNAAKVIVKIMSSSPEWASTLRPELPQEVDSVIERALQRERERRISSCVELAEQLGAALGVAWPCDKLASAPVERLEAAAASGQGWARPDPSGPVAQAPGVASRLSDDGMPVERLSLDPAYAPTPGSRVDPRRSVETWVPDDWRARPVRRDSSVPPGLVLVAFALGGVFLLLSIVLIVVRFL